jgi:hypothetical protein
MRAALICLPPPGGAASLQIAGRSAAQCQLALALQCGCDVIVAHGHGNSGEAISLRHRAEAAGARFQTVNNAHALIGAVGEGDSLLVMQDGLWPEAGEVLEALRSPACVVVLPAGVGVQAGFEQIDLDRAWAGALVLPGQLLAALGGLPEDIAPAPALLRVALQNRLPETRLAVEHLDDGSWCLLDSPVSAGRYERRWLRRVVGEGRGSGVSARLARLALNLHGAKLAGHPRGFAAAIAVLAGLWAGAMAAAWQGYAATGFALLALAAMMTELNIGLARIRAAPFGKVKHWPGLRYVLDAALGICAVCAIDGLWQRAVFAPLVLIAGLLLLDRREWPPLAEALRDRGVIAAALAVLVLALSGEPAIMLVAGILLCANLMPVGRGRG